MKNIVILISGSGSNMAAIVRTAQQERWQETLGARVAAVISNKARAGGLQFAQAQGIATTVRALTRHWCSASTPTRLRWWCWPGSCAF